jgi:hypothetical protein
MQAPPGAFRPRRRTVLAAGAALPLVASAASAPSRPDRRGPAAGDQVLRFLSADQAAVVTEATARLVPGPLDDPAEAGHPGAREAGVVWFVDRLLSAFDQDPPAVFAGAPWSNRHAAGPDRMAHFLPLVERQEKAWRPRIAKLRHDVTVAVDALDDAAKEAGYDGFVAAPKQQQDRLLTELDAVRDLLFGLTIDALYSVPEYAGNAGRVGWNEIDWPGDIQPVGYRPAAVEGDDGVDPVAAGDLPVVHEVLGALPHLDRLQIGRRG